MTLTAIQDKRNYNPKHLFLFFVVVVLFLLTRSFVPLYMNTQNEYYAHAFARAHENLLQNDWFTHTQLKHIVFSWMVEGLYRLNIAQTGTHIIEFILEAIFYISAFYIFQSIFESIKKRNVKFHQLDTIMLALVAVFVLCVIHNSAILVGLANRFRVILPDAHHLWREFSNFSGLAVQVMNGGYLQPSEFGILFMAAFALALRSRWRIATVLIAVAINFHFSYAISGGVFLLVFLGILLYEKQWRRAFEICVIFGLLVLPITLYAASFLGDPLADFAARVFAVEMFPFHSIPSVFWDRPLQMNTLKTIIMVIGILLCWRFQMYRLLSIMLVAFISVMGSIIFVQLTLNYSIAILFPWRTSVFLVPLATMIIIAIIIWIVATLLQGRWLDKKWFQSILVLMLMVVIAGEGYMFVKWTLNVGSTSNVEGTSEEGGVDPQQIYAEITNATAPTAIILVPLEDHELLPDRFWTNAKLATQRAVYLDGFSFPMRGEDVQEFWDRLQFVKAFYEQPLKIQLELCKEANVDYFASDTMDPSLDVKPVLEMYPVYLYPCE